MRNTFSLRSSASAALALLLGALPLYADNPIVVSGAATGNVSEDGPLTATGTLTATDADPADNPLSFTAVTDQLGDQGHGDFSIDASGNWSYDLDSTDPAVQALGSDDTLTDTHTFTVTTQGTQVVVSDSFSDGDVATNAGGVGSGFTLVTNGAGGTGTLSESNGKQVTTTVGGADNSGIVSNDTMSVTSSDVVTITWDVAGAVNPIYNGVELIVQGGTGFRTADILDLILRPTGEVLVLGTSATSTHTPAAVLDGFTVTLTADVNGWSYTSTGLDGFTLSGAYGTKGFIDIFDGGRVGATIQGVDPAAELTLNAITVTVGKAPASQEVAVTISGGDDPIVVAGTTTGTVQEDGTLTASGTLTATDPDTADNPTAFATITGQTGNQGYGDFSIDADGNWFYDLDNASTEVQALNAGESLADTYLFTAITQGTQVVVNDSFGDGDAGTNAGGVGSGFTLVTNGAGGTGVLSESGGKQTTTTNGETDNSGIVSNDILSVTSDDVVTVTWDIASATNPQYNGVELIVQGGTGFRTADILDLVLRPSGETLVLGPGLTSTHTPAAVLDGFTVTLTADASGWTYTSTGLDGFTLSGGYGTKGFVDIFDGGRVGATIQGGTPAAELAMNAITVTVGKAAVSQQVAVTIDGYNDAPTLELTPVVASLADDADTSANTLVATLAITDEDAGTNTLTLSGDDAASFVIEGDELFLAAGTTLDAGTQSSLSVTVEVDDTTTGETPDDTAVYTLAVTQAEPTQPTLTLTSTDSSAAEDGSDPGEWTFTRDLTAGDLAVHYTVSGDASAGDYSETLSGSVVIADGETTATLTLTPVDDSDDEDTETVTLTLAADAAYVLGSPATGSVTIADNDLPPTIDPGEGTPVVVELPAGAPVWSAPTGLPTSSDLVHVTEVVYDAASRPQDQIDAAGRITRVEYDDLGRTLTQIENYLDGVPGSEPTGDDDRIIRYTYNAANQTVTQTADLPAGENDQVTHYIYSGELTVKGSPVASNGLLRATLYPDALEDGTSRQDAINALNAGNNFGDFVAATYTATGQQATRTDQRYVRLTYTYDDAGRRASQEVSAVATGTLPGGDQRVDYTYTVKGQMLTATTYSDANGSVNDITSELQYEYAPLGQMTREYQAVTGAVDTLTTPFISYAYDDTTDVDSAFTTSYRRTSVTYPGGRKIHMTYANGLDSDLSRVSELADDNSGNPGNIIAAFERLGSGRVVSKSMPTPGIRLNYADANGDVSSESGNGGWDRFGRITKHGWEHYDTQAGNTTGANDLFEVQHGYDRMGSRLYAHRVDTPAMNTRSQLFRHDQLNRMIGYERGELAAAKDGIVANTERDSTDWTLNHWGNQLQVDKTEDDGVTASTLIATFNDANEFETRGPQGQEANLTHDAAGNLTFDGMWSFSFDAWNKLIGATHATEDAVSMRYDAMGRRVAKTQVSAMTYFYHEGQSTVEERDTANVIQSTQVWAILAGGYIDEMIETTQGSTSYYALHNANYNVMAIIVAGGTVVERYEYTPYGERKAYDATYAELATEALTPYGHQGLRHEAGLPLVYNRARHLHVGVGRFVQRDPWMSNPNQMNAGDGYQDGLSIYAYYPALLSGLDPTGKGLINVAGPWVWNGSAFYQLTHVAPLTQAEATRIAKASSEKIFLFVGGIKEHCSCKCMHKAWRIRRMTWTNRITGRLSYEYGVLVKRSRGFAAITYGVFRYYNGKLECDCENLTGQRYSHPAGTGTPQWYLSRPYRTLQRAQDKVGWAYGYGSPPRFVDGSDDDHGLYHNPPHSGYMFPR